MTTASEPHPSTGQPVGLPVDAAPAQRPGPVTLQGRYGSLEKLTMRHAEDLWQAFQGHDHVWTYISTDGPFPDKAGFFAFLQTRAEAGDPYALPSSMRRGERSDTSRSCRSGPTCA
jgi:hypothetical protein